MFSRQIDQRYKQSGAFGLGFYFFKSANSAASQAFETKDNKRQILFGLVITGESTTQQPVDGQMPVKDDDNLVDSVTGTGEHEDKVFIIERNQAYPCWLVEFE